MEQSLQNFFGLPVINEIDGNRNTIYGYTECSWDDVPEYKGNYINALRSNNHVWKCYRGTYKVLKKKYESFIVRTERNLDKVPDREYDLHGEDAFFKGTIFFVLENDIPAQIFTSARELIRGNRYPYVLRDLSMLQGNCPPFVWNI